MSSQPNDASSGQPRRQSFRRRPISGDGPRNRRSYRRGTNAPFHRRRRTATLTFGHTLSPAAISVWPFAGVDQLPGTALLPGWLGRVVVTLVTHYTRPGDRVLLLTPPTSRHQPTTTGHGRAPDPYTGLTEALWTVIRLGRSADTAIAAFALGQPSDSTVPTGPPDRDGLARGDRPQSTKLHPCISFSCHSETEGRPADIGDGHAERFDLIITTAQPHDLGWLADTDWNTVLARSGLLAAITHCEERNGRLQDPLRTITGALRSQGWSWHDHIAVLIQPLPEPTDSPSLLPVPAAIPSPVSSASPQPMRSVHHDLLLFSATPPTAREDANDTGDTSDE